MNEQHADVSEPAIGTIIQRRLSRREAISAAMAGAMLAIGPHKNGSARSLGAPGSGSVFQFSPIPHVSLSSPAARTIRLAAGHEAQVLLRWGDALFDQPGFDPTAQSAQSQLKRFGYNNDFVAFLPLPIGSANSQHGLLFVNHEYTNGELMFQGFSSRAAAVLQITSEQAQIEMAAHGLSVVEIVRQQQSGRAKWVPVTGSRYNRRISALCSTAKLSGPVAGHRRVRTSADPTGTQVIGTLNNCSGGVTPWGTVLSGEENFQHYFQGDPTEGEEAENLKRYNVGGELNYGWYRFDPRFCLSKEPNEPNRFGWVVELDPYDPGNMPIKRTALGRLRHEGAATCVNHDGRVVVYMGDDQAFEFLYKFVTRRPYDRTNRQANRDLLDDGMLYVARFGEDGTVRWLPLVWGQGPLTGENGFQSQADVLLETRRAASLLRATPMDRPEDVEANPTTGNVYVVLTNNTSRKENQLDRANPRANNRHGHVIELRIGRTGGLPDHAATEHGWEIFLRAGDWQRGDGWYQGGKPPSWISCPDNCTFDSDGRLWLATDGAPKAAGFTDGLYACDTVGPERGLTRLFFAAPVGAEVCGPCFTPDGSTLFVAVQHPGEGTTYEAPSTRWPNPQHSSMPPQPAIVAIMRTPNA